MTESAPPEVSLLKRAAFVNRTTETRSLTGALHRAKGGEASAWLLDGAEGIGKTRLARWLEEAARIEGFEVRWGHGVRDSLVPFQPMELMFRAAPESTSAGPSTSRSAPGAGRTPLVLVEESKARRFWTLVENSLPRGQLVVVTRERPASLRTARPSLEKANAILWMTRLEGPENVAPTDLDGLGDRLQEHLHSAPGSTVALEGLEYLVSQGSFLPVLRTLQFLRDVAQETGGQVLVALNPASLEPREVSLLESDAELDAEPVAVPVAGTAARPATVDSPTSILLRLLSEVETACERSPQLLVVDDLQWADPATVRAFQFLVRNTRDRPVVWLGCVRSSKAGQEEPSPGEGAAGLRDVLEHMEREGALQRISLRALPREEVRRLLTGATDVPLDLDRSDPSFREFIDRTEGNPHFALSGLRLLWEQGRLRREGSVAVVEPVGPVVVAADDSAGAPAQMSAAVESLPASLRSAATERLRLLPAPERKFLAIAALIGKDFDLPPIADRMGRTKEELEHLASELEVGRGIVRPVFGSPDRWSFQDGTAWEASLELLDPTERRSESRALGLWWQQHRPQDHDAHARLFFASGDRELARPALRRSVQTALGQQNPDAVERYVGWSRDLAGSDPEEVAERAKEEIEVALGLRQFGATRSAVRILRGLEPLNLPTEVRRNRELALSGAIANTDPTEAWSHVRKLEEEVGTAPAEEVSKLFRARLAAVRASLHLSANEFELGKKAAEDGLALLPDRQASEVAAALLFQAGWCSQELEQWGAARKYFEEALDVSRQGSVEWGVAQALAGLATLNYFFGDLRSARALYEQAIEMARKRGEVQRGIPLLLNLVDVEASMGDQATAWAHLEEATKNADRFDLAHWRAAAAAQKGDLLARERKWGEAGHAYELALERGRSLTRRPNLVQIRLGQAWVKGELKDPKAGIELLGKLESGPTPLPAEYKDTFYEIRARLRELEGSPGEARVDLEAARGKTGPSPHRQARILGDLSSWESLHGDAEKASSMRKASDDLYRAAGIDPEKASGFNEVFPGPRSPQGGEAPFDAGETPSPF